jgi:hypothetical protein
MWENECYIYPAPLALRADNVDFNDLIICTRLRYLEWMLLKPETFCLIPNHFPILLSWMVVCKKIGVRENELFPSVKYHPVFLYRSKE